MFLLRYRDPVRYGAWLDTVRAGRAPDAATLTLNRLCDQVAADAHARDAGAPLPPPFVRFVPTRYVPLDEREVAPAHAAAAAAATDADAAAREASWQAMLDRRNAAADRGPSGR